MVAVVREQASMDPLRTEWRLLRRMKEEEMRVLAAVTYCRLAHPQSVRRWEARGRSKVWGRGMVAVGRLRRAGLRVSSPSPQGSLPSQRLTRRMLAPRARPIARPCSTDETVSDLLRRIESWTTRRRLRRGCGDTRPCSSTSSFAFDGPCSGSDSWLLLACEPSRVVLPLGVCACWRPGT